MKVTVSGKTIRNSKPFEVIDSIGRNLPKISLIIPIGTFLSSQLTSGLAYYFDAPQETISLINEVGTTNVSASIVISLACLSISGFIKLLKSFS
ncbi:hypothetical protein [Robertmurraya sp.]|uniref:hypothetical protein n=1 Tax=Robertmurraya sp. TaxID=2837525 RepID=UPI0037041F9C